MKNKGQSTLAVIAITICCLILAAAIGVGVWRLGWYVETKNTDKRTQIYSHSDGRQLALVDSILSDIKQVTGPNVPPEQKVAIVGEICSNAGKLTGKEVLPQSAITFIAKECSQP